MQSEHFQLLLKKSSSVIFVLISKTSFLGSIKRYKFYRLIADFVMSGFLHFPQILVGLVNEFW